MNTAQDNRRIGTRALLAGLVVLLMLGLLAALIVDVPPTKAQP